MRLGRLACFLCPFFAYGQRPTVDQTRDHWAFQSIGQPATPQVLHSLSAIDSFVLDKLQEKKLQPGLPASKSTLLGRVSFDLTGLPATYQEVLEFENDLRPDALERKLDKLLASPRFGERWGRHWLDLARYSDTKGYLVGGASRSYPFAYSYRDWVFRSLNAGMPFDSFIRKQLAADLLLDSPNHPDLAALGFLTIGPRFLNRRHLIIDDRIDVVTRGLMGFTVGCARCHDHFYDPVPQEDYYSLYGVFDLTKEPEELPVIGRPDPSSPDYKAFEAKLRALEKAVEDHLISKWRFLRSENGLRAYLQVVHDGYDLSDDRLDALASKRKLYPKLAIRWRKFLANKDKSGDRLFRAWRAFAQTSANNYPKVSADLLSSRDGIPVFVVQNLKKSSPKKFSEVISWYASEFAQVLAQIEKGNSTKGIGTILASSAFPVSFSSAELERYFDTEVRNKTNSLRAKVTKHHAEHPGSPPRAMILLDESHARNPRILERGNPSAPGREVPRRFLAALSPEAVRKSYGKGSGRLELAQSILSPGNPLTVRVFVNRVWQQVMGEGIVRTTSDFGLRGDSPSHPRLLDHLSSSFQADSWDLKRLLRRIALSEVYGRSSGTPPASDSSNRFLSVMNRKRLDFEAMRDAMLFVSGDLDLTVGGRSVKLNEKPYSFRRAAYGYVDRQNIPALLRTFDFSNPNIHTPARPETTVPQQALFALNDPFVLARAETLGGSSAAQSPEVAIRSLYRRILSRDPSPRELTSARVFLGQESTLPELVDLAQALLVSNEFFFID
ncbi:MAG: hypothetical protein CMI31_06965 [Opitutae bacterium]|nr:hypothetical protein [Opitutae bacterium]|tara:strand:+ start:8909 stop:11254 length:2346 start_codon:yes stop_codon:yes gene_type:complete